VLESNQAATVSFARDAAHEPSNAVETAIIALPCSHQSRIWIHPLYSKSPIHEPNALSN
jgi:hypothetical protein